MMKPVVMPKSEQEQLARLVRELGGAAAARQLEVAPMTLARAAAGFGVARSTASVLRQKLIEQTRPAA